jgi:hypothetical protein
MSIFEKLHNNITFFILNKMTEFREKLDNASNYKNYDEWYSSSVNKLKIFHDVIHEHKTKGNFRIIQDKGETIYKLDDEGYFNNDIMTILYDVYPILFSFDCSDDIYNLVNEVICPFIHEYYS